MSGRHLKEAQSQNYFTILLHLRRLFISMFQSKISLKKGFMVSNALNKSEKTTSSNFCVLLPVPVIVVRLISVHNFFGFILFRLASTTKELCVHVGAVGYQHYVIIEENKN